MEWLKTGDLVLENQMLNEAWGDGFENHDWLRSREPGVDSHVEQKKVSIVDYFLLLPIASKAHRRFSCGTRKPAAIFIFARPNRVKEYR